MVATAVPTIVPAIVSQDMAGIGVKARFADANFTNTSPRYLSYNNKWPSVEAFAGGVLATRRIDGRLFAQIEQAVQCVVTENKDLDDNDWSKARCTISPNAVAAPDGLSTADKQVIDGTNSNNHYILQNFTPDGSSRYCISVYAKKAQYNHIATQVTTAGFPNATLVYYNINTCAIGTETGSPDSTGIEECGNGWCRCWFSVTSDAAAATSLIVYMAEADGTVTIATGDSSSGTYSWMPQVVIGAVPSSPIHTEAVAVTRNAD